MAKKAFIVDDEDSLREVVKELLNMWEIETIEAKDGQQALNEIEQNDHSFDLIFIDINLPKLSGKELYEQLYPRFPEAKYIFMSGYLKNQALPDLPKTGSYSYLKKPFQVAQLKAMIDELLKD